VRKVLRPLHKVEAVNEQTQVGSAAERETPYKAEEHFQGNQTHEGLVAGI